MSMLVGVSLSQIHQLPQQQRILEDALDRFNQVRFERPGQLLARVARTQEILQVACVVCTASRRNSSTNRRQSAV